MAPRLTDSDVSNVVVMDTVSTRQRHVAFGGCTDSQHVIAGEFVITMHLPSRMSLLGDGVVDVIPRGSQKQMLRPHAKLHIAFVQDQHSGRDVATFKNPSGPVGADILSVEVQSPVTVRSVAMPQPA